MAVTKSREVLDSEAPRYTKYPVTCDALGAQFSATECWTAGAAVPVPVRGILRTVFEALLEIERVPCAEAADVGSKLTEIVTEPFGVNVAFDPPLALKAAPVIETPEIAMFVPPESVRLMVFVTGVPTVTFPNATLVALAVSCERSGSVDGLLLATPVAESGI
jgi:hypothetical protein